MRSATDGSPTAQPSGGVSVATVIRDAIDRGLAEPANAKAEAARRLLAADLMPAPSVEELRSELDEFHGRYA